MIPSAPPILLIFRVVKCRGAQLDNKGSRNLQDHPVWRTSEHAEVRRLAIPAPTTGHPRGIGVVVRPVAADGQGSRGQEQPQEDTQEHHPSHCPPSFAAIFPMALAAPDKPSPSMPTVAAVFPGKSWPRPARSKP